MLGRTGPTSVPLLLFSICFLFPSLWSPPRIVTWDRRVWMEPFPARRGHLWVTSCCSESIALCYPGLWGLSHFLACFYLLYLHRLWRPSINLWSCEMCWVLSKDYRLICSRLTFLTFGPGGRVYHAGLNLREGAEWGKRQLKAPSCLLTCLEQVRLAQVWTEGPFPHGPICAGR